MKQCCYIYFFFIGVCFLSDNSVGSKYTRRLKRYHPKATFRESRSENSDTWTFRAGQTVTYVNRTHNILSPLAMDEHSYIMDPDEPIFDQEHSANITALLGKTAVLNCRVKNIGNKTISWVRHRDIHLLTVGKFSYTSDQRFQAVHTDGSEDWLLKIHYLQERDAGWYECQISATPPRSHMIHLSVVEPETSIEGGPDVFINTGSRLSLTCNVKYSPEPPAFIFWYHNDRLVSYDRTRGGVDVQMKKGHVSTSTLLVQYAEPHHSGLYTCSPANSKPKSVNVHVLAGEQPAAILHENNSISTISKFSLSSLICLSILSLTHVLIL